MKRIYSFNCISLLSIKIGNFVSKIDGFTISLERMHSESPAPLSLATDVSQIIFDSRHRQIVEHVFLRQRNKGKV